MCVCVCSVECLKVSCSFLAKKDAINTPAFVQMFSGNIIT